MDVQERYETLLVERNKAFLVFCSIVKALRSPPGMSAVDAGRAMGLAFRLAQEQAEALEEEKAR